MQSIAYIKASDGSGNASVVTVQNSRSPGATTIQGDTVQGLPTQFYGTMGTPHTFTDPITDETLTVISEATAVDFAGHVDGANLEIDEIAPGYTDAGSSVGDIVIIRPITEYANNLHNILNEAHNDDGSLRDIALDDFYKPSEVTTADFVASGGVIAQTSGLTASFSDLVYYINGHRYTKTGVANRLYTGSKDTYVDIGTDGTLDYTEVANGATAPALSADHVRLAKVVTNGSAITSVVQTNGDGLGNIIRPIGSVNDLEVNATIAFKAYKTAQTQSLSNSTITILQLDLKDFDIGNDYNTSTYKFTAPVNGVYHFEGQLSIDATGSQCLGYIYVNGTAAAMDNNYNNASTDDMNARVNCTLYLNAGDEVDFRGHHNAGAGRTLLASKTNTFFSGFLVGRA